MFPSGVYIWNDEQSPLLSRLGRSAGMLAPNQVYYIYCAEEKALWSEEVRQAPTDQNEGWTAKDMQRLPLQPVQNHSERALPRCECGRLIFDPDDYLCLFCRDEQA